MSRLNCSTNFLNSAGADCAFDVGAVIGYVLTPVDFEIADIATANLEATWTSLINLAQGSRGFPIIYDGYLQAITPTDDDPVMEEGLYGVRSKSRDGNKRNTMTFFNLAPCVTKALKSYDNQVFRAFAITKNGYWLGYSEDGTKAKGFKVKFFAKHMQKPADDATGWKTTYYIDYVDANEFDKNLIFGKPTAFDIKELVGIKDAYLELVSAGTSAIVVDIKGNCDNVGVSGLVTADIELTLDSTGGAVTAAATESTTVLGRYSLAGTFTTAAHTLNLKQQPTMTLKGYESTGSIAVTPE